MINTILAQVEVYNTCYILFLILLCPLHEVSWNISGCRLSPCCIRLQQLDSRDRLKSLAAHWRLPEMLPLRSQGTELLSEWRMALDIKWEGNKRRYIATVGVIYSLFSSLHLPPDVYELFHLLILLLLVGCPPALHSTPNCSRAIWKEFWPLKSLFNETFSTFLWCVCANLFLSFASVMTEPKQFFSRAP